MTARLGRAVANGSAAPSAKAVRRVSEELCNDEDVAKAVRRVSEALCNDDDVPCCFIRRELVGGSVRGNSDLCDRNCVCSACAGMICAFRSAWRGVSADSRSRQANTLGRYGGRKSLGRGKRSKNSLIG